MAKRLPFTDSFGQVWPDGYWDVRTVQNLDPAQHTATAVIRGWGTQAEHDAGRPERASRVVTLEGAVFDQFIGAKLPTGVTASDFWAAALAIRDHQTGTAEDGSPVYESYFAGAVDV